MACKHWQEGPTDAPPAAFSSDGLSTRAPALRGNAPSGAPIAITTRPPCLCQIPSHIIGAVTTAFRVGVGAVPPVLRCPMAVPASRSRRICHPAYLSTCGCPPSDYLGPTGLGNEGGPGGLPNDTVCITHAVALTLAGGAKTCET
jgi:hypothetical protein